MRRKYLNDPTPFLDFCDYPPFEEDFDLYFNNLEFSIMQKMFVPRLKLARCLISKKKISQLYTCKNSFPSAPPKTNPTFFVN
jgi:hypothetical protein